MLCSILDVFLSAFYLSVINRITPQQDSRYLSGGIHHLIEASFEELDPQRLKVKKLIDYYFLNFSLQPQYI
jgi:hypothetical protein